MTTSRLQYLIDELQRDASLHKPDRLSARIDAMDRLESALLHVGDDTESSLRRRGFALLAELEAVNRELYRSIREDIRQGRGAASLRGWAGAMHGREGQEGYDALDTLLGGVLDFEEPRDVAELAPDMVFYQPTPARHIFDFMARAHIDESDVVMDLGSGLGHVAIVTAACTGARCIGVEVEPAYVASACACANALQVRNAHFITQDVRHADLSEGTVFYLYTPFTGAILRVVLNALRRESERRVIRLCTLGPCTPILANESWLQGERLCTPERPALWQSL